MLLSFINDIKPGSLKISIFIQCGNIFSFLYIKKAYPNSENFNLSALIFIYFLFIFFDGLYVYDGCWKIPLRIYNKKKNIICVMIFFFLLIQFILVLNKRMLATTKIKIQKKNKFRAFVWFGGSDWIEYNIDSVNHK